jgi:hypothetical protein
MRRLMKCWTGPAVAAIVALNLSGPACAAATVRTAASLEVRDAASVTVVNSVPLQLLLSSGTDTMFSLTASSKARPGGGSDLLMVNGSNAWSGMTSDGEVLSVSVASAVGEQPSGPESGGAVKFVIAQFN